MEPARSSRRPSDTSDNTAILSLWSPSKAPAARLPCSPHQLPLESARDRITGPIHYECPGLTESSELQPWLRSKIFSTMGPAKRHMKEEANSPCHECYEMLQSCLHAGATSTNFEDYFRSIDIHELEASAKSCSICSLCLSILRGPDGIVLAQTKAYNDDGFNIVSHYDENGVTDIDEILETNPKTAVHLRAYPDTLACTPNMCDGLTFSFHINFRTQRCRVTRKSMHAQEKVTIFKPSPVGSSLQTTATDRSSGKDVGFFAARPLLEPMDDPRLKSHQKMDLIQSWLEEAIQQKSIQPEEPQPPKCVYPARLLDLSNEGQARLIDCAIEFAYLLARGSLLPRYIALSHRWGASQHLTATMQTMALLSAGVSLQGLPQTFRDAVFTTRKLGFSFIWIDALCIIQDSAEDWLLESQKMGDIFQNAVVTISAHCAGDDSEGFLATAFSKRKAMELSVDGYNIGLCRQPSPDLDVTASALSRRGWVLQERFLSTRLLHFTRGQVYFETRNIFCEDGSRVASSDRSTKQGFQRSENLQSPLLSPSELPDLRYLLGLEPSRQIDSTGTSLEWSDLVETYTRCELTKDTDKLIAISGMARKIYDKTRVHWCSGIWRDYLCQGLLWLPTIDGLSAPTKSRAPSWSWAAWGGAIQYPKTIKKPRFRPRCELVSLRNGDGDDVTWLNGAGSLSLRGRLLPLVASMPQVVQLGPGPPRRGNFTSGRHGLPLLPLKNYVRVHGFYDPSFHGPAGWVAFDDSRKAALSEGNLFQLAPNCITTASTDPVFVATPRRHFLILGTYQKSFRFSESYTYKRNEDDWYFLGIVLESLGNGTNAFRRVGFGQLSRQYIRSQSSDIETPISELLRNSSGGRKTPRGWEEALFFEQYLTTVKIE